MSHNLTVISSLPDIINFSLLEMHTEFTVSSCLPIIKFFYWSHKSHNLTVLSSLADTTKCWLLEMQTDIIY